MKTSPEGRESPSFLASPNSNSTNSSSSSSNSSGVHNQFPLTPKPTNKSQTSTDPTTFIQADTSSFKQLVQMLTGSSETVKQASNTTTTTTNNASAKSVIRPIKTGPKKQGNKLYERRNSFKNFKASPLMSGLVQNCGFSPRELEMLSPSILDFPSLVISPDTPLTPDPFNRSPTTYTTSNLSLLDQGRIIEKRFYLHSSPIASPRDSVPQLLPLFPMISPKVAGSST